VNATPPARRDQRALTIGVAAIAGLVAGARGLPSWLEWRAEARAAAVEKLTEAGETAAVLAGLSESLDSLEARTDRMVKLAPALFVGETPAEAGANLTAAVSEMARASLVRLDAVETRVDTSGHRDLPRVRLDAQATADVTGLAELLQRLEAGPTLLVVRRLTVRTFNPQADSTEVETLSVRLTVEGLAFVSEKGRAP
jgi:hypothetical protein